MSFINKYPMHLYVDIKEQEYSASERKYFVYTVLYTVLYWLWQEHKHEIAVAEFFNTIQAFMGT